MLLINGIRYQDYRIVLEADRDAEEKREWNAGAVIFGIVLLIVTIIVTL